MYNFKSIFAFVCIAYLCYQPLHVTANGVVVTTASPNAESVGDDSVDEADMVSNYPLRCLVRQFNFTATVTDTNGKRCRGQVSTKACFGSCDSYEVGTFEFPWIVRVQPVCNYDGVVMKEIRLSDCDAGVDGGALVYRFPEASSCSCSICDPTQQACETSPTKRSSPSMEEEVIRRMRRISDQHPNRMANENAVPRSPGLLSWLRLRQRND